MANQELKIGDWVIDSEHEFGRGYTFLWEICKDLNGLYAFYNGWVIDKEGKIDRTYDRDHIAYLRHNTKVKWLKNFLKLP